MSCKVDRKEIDVIAFETRSAIALMKYQIGRLVEAPNAVVDTSTSEPRIHDCQWHHPRDSKHYTVEMPRARAS